MDTDRKILRLGAVVIIGAIALRLAGDAGLGKDSLQMDHARIAETILFLQTGRTVQPPHIPETEPSERPTETAPEETRKIPEVVPVSFEVEDGELVQISGYGDFRASTEQLLLQPLEWELMEDTPTVLILHSHGSESYRNTENYTESSDYRTLDERYNVISVGDRLAECLEAAGIRVIHDRDLHDYPSYNGSYAQSRESVSEWLEKEPTLRLVLDLHRDAVADSLGEQIRYAVETDRGTAAKMMLVVGTNHVEWENNMALAVKIQAQLEKQTPGICRPISLRTARFNQDLSPGMVLVEMGAAGNTRQEALLAAETLAEAVIALAHGTS